MKIALSNVIDTTQDYKELGAESNDLIEDVIGVDYTFSMEFMPSRAADGVKVVREVMDDEILELELADGSVWYVTHEEMAELDLTSRGGAVELNPYLFARGDARDALENPVQAVRGVKVQLPSAEQIEEKIKDLAVEPVIDGVSYLLARGIEKQISTAGVTSLCRVELQDHQAKLEQIKSGDIQTGGDHPWLLLLHGTMSSTEGSFGGLWSEGSAYLSRLRGFYQDRIIALEHCTLTESPIENVLSALGPLPRGIQLHMLSHSRGGLVGELLCRGSRRVDPILPEEQMLFEQELEATRGGFQDLGDKVIDLIRDYRVQEVKRVKEVNRLLRDKQISVDRFVRVACPARGTTLASGKLGRWANRVFNVVGLIPSVGINPIYQAFKTFSLGVLKAGTKPVVLPGLYSQMPSSALVHLLNNPRVPVPADLSVVAGDTEAKGWKKAPLWIMDQFFGGEHDLVVNTASMDGGSERSDGIRKMFLQGDEVSHFNYFENRDSAEQIVRRLIYEDADRFVQHSMPKDVAIPRGRVSRSLKPGPVVYVLPGVLGSTLDADGDNVWANYLRLTLGGMKRLGIDEEGVTAEHLFSSHYGELIDYLSATHHVEVYPYDWRMPLQRSASHLAEKLTQELNLQRATEDPQPIRILAHSMGGLVARVMIQQHREVWNRLTEHPGARLLMAGTPTHGSYTIPRMLLGRERLVRLLALADMHNSKEKILDIISAYPGMLAMLPNWGQLDWLNEKSWKDLARRIKDRDWKPLDEKRLASAREARELLSRSEIDPDRMLYIAGVGERTLCNAEIENDKVRFLYTRSGDGIVTWQHGIPGEITKRWFMPAEHGSLLSTVEYFDAWVDLLETGTTDRLQTSPPVGVARGEMSWDAALEARDEVIDYLPDERTLLQIGFGESSIRGAVPEPIEPVLNITLAHANLKYAKYPVAVGHYIDDPIMHAERALDDFLNNRLEQRHRAGLYPGPVGTSDVIFSEKDERIPEGALVIGLGEYGQLTAAKLERTLTLAFVKYAISLDEWHSAKDDRSTMDEVGLSILLIGSGIGGVSLHDSVASIIRAAVDANKKLRDLPGEPIRTLFNIELIELWQDLALEAVHALGDVVRGMDRSNIKAKHDVSERDGGLKRTYRAQNVDWWHRLAIRGDGSGSLQFNTYTRRARSELEYEAIDLKFVDRYLEEIIETTSFDPNSVTSPQRTLFELLLPNRLKESSPDSDRMLLSIDEHAARYPWEMLIDGWADKPEPLAVSKQIIRQLATDEFRANPQPSSGRAALVIGDPPAGDRYPSLRGAREEAHQVSRCITEDSSFEVVSIIREENDDTSLALKIVQELLCREYAILHFAAHGTYERQSKSDDNTPDEAGVVIGPGMILSPARVRKMRKVPELVFLNCCHLGFIEERKIDQHVAYRDIAANLSTEFIRMGSKCVVAAGWEVQDAPAKLFAGVFYEELLTGGTFAQAVRQARLDVYKAHPHANTFGAYQCWGDPGYRLRSDKLSSYGGPAEINFRADQEWEVEARNIRSGAKTANDEESHVLLRRLQNLHRQFIARFGDPDEGNGKNVWEIPRVRALIELARAYGELGDLKSAIILIRAALRTNASAISFEDLEQLANFEARHAVEIETKEAKATLEEDPRDLARGSIGRLKQILDYGHVTGSSSNRGKVLSIMASAYRRQAMVTDEHAGIDESLDLMYRYYGLAWVGEHESAMPHFTSAAFCRLAAERNLKPDDYAFANFVLGAIVKAWYPKGGQLTRINRDFEDFIRQHVVKCRGRVQRALDFWGAIELSDCLMLFLLNKAIRKQAGITASDEELVTEIENVYQNIRRRIGSRRQWSSVYDLLLFIQMMLNKKPKQATDGLPREHIRGLVNLVAPWAGRRDR